MTDALASLLGPAVRQPAHDPVVPAWRPPLDRHDLSRFLVATRLWALDGEAVLDTIADVLDDQAPPAEDVVALYVRLRRDLRLLLDIARDAGLDDLEACASLLAPTVGAEPLLNPRDFHDALGRLRVLGWTALDLLERLVETRCVPAVA